MGTGIERRASVANGHKLVGPISRQYQVLLGGVSVCPVLVYLSIFFSLAALRFIVAAVRLVAKCCLPATLTAILTAILAAILTAILTAVLTIN